jgi:putative ABC transport system permease protein
MRIYRLLSKVFPRAFRTEFEQELETTAADLMRAEGSKGALHRARLWIGLSADAVTRGLAERRAENRAHLTPSGSLMRSVAAEWRQAVRALVSRPGFALIVITLLGLGMGANAAVFGVVNATLLRPLPFADPERLVILWEQFEPMKLETMPWSDPDYVSVRSASAFEGTVVFRPRRLVLTGRGEPASLEVTIVEGGVFDVLGTTALRGRLLTQADTETGNDTNVVISHASWTERFNADASIVGQSIVVDNKPRTIVGVLRPGVSFPPPITYAGQMISPEPELYVPYKLDTSANARGSHNSFAMGRLRRGISLEAAQAEMKAVADRVEREFPDTNTGVKMRVDSLHGQSVVTIRGALYLLLAAVGGVLLIACASISNLMLARASGRSREMALRAALGAGRASLVRQLLFESLVLGVCGTLVGLVSAQWISSALVTLNPIDLPNIFRASIDWRVLTFTTAMTLAAVFAFGLAPALAGSRTDLMSTMRSGARTTASRGERRTKAALVVLQVSLAVVLLVGSGLMIRSLVRLWNVDPGFNPQQVVATSISLPATRYPTDVSQRQFQERWLERVAAVPGVRSAATMTLLPFAFNKSASDYSIVGEPERKTGDYLIASYNYVSPAFSAVLRASVIEGRPLNDGDRADATLVALISESLAKRHWPRGGAVGHQMLFGGAEGEKPKTIVGVVRDLRMDGFDADVTTTIYVPQAQSPVPSFWTAIATDRPANAVAGELRAALREVDPSLPSGEIRALTEIMGDTVEKPRFTAVVLSAFAAAALLIAAIGLYGVLAFDVAQQKRELGVRVALGASPGGIGRLVLTRGFRLVGAGLIAGSAVSLAGTRLISDLLFDAPALDIVPLAIATGVLGLTALIATWLPARRAMKADPIEALRAQ